MEELKINDYKLSVIVTAYNKQDTITRCIDSILKSTFKDFELIIVEDKSTDNTLEVIKGIKDDRIKIIEHTENKGAGLSRRDGIEAAKGEFVSLIDGDDYISENFYEDLLKKQEETGADIVSGGITNINIDGTTDIKLFGTRVSEGHDKLKDYGKGTIIFLNNKIVKRMLYDIVQYSDKRYCEDTPVIIPLLYWANKVAYVDNAGYFYNHMDPNALTRKVSIVRHMIACADCCAYLREYFKDKEDGEFWRESLSMQQFVGYLYTARRQNATAEDVKDCIPELLNSLYYLLDNIVKENK